MRVTIDGCAVETAPGESPPLLPPPSLFECAERAGVRVPTSCRKNGKCRECLVEVASGMEHLTARAPEEDHLGGAYRLSCRARLTSSGAEGEVVCRTLQRGAMQITDSGEGGSDGTTGAAAGPIDPAVTRRGGDVFIEGERVASWPGPLHGVAVDVGTTTVVARLVDLESGAVLATRSFENPQRFGGSDVMARIHYDGEHPGRLLQRTLLAYLGHAIEDFDCAPDSIFEVVVAGNATMRDLFFGLDVATIGQRPYRSLTEHELISGQRATTALDEPRAFKKLRLPVNPAARAYGLPLISGHVGADTAACLLAVGLLDEERLVALMDIGTNTEFAVGNRHRLHVASCPAGPAFEGGAISCGLPGLEGAIDRVQLDADGAATYTVIGGGPAEGICGSGLVDLLSELRRSGRMDELGRYVDESGRFTVDAAREIHLTEADISELAQAKGANVAGAQIALARSGVDPAQVERFYLAGGFARHLDLAAARRIGLIPNFPDNVIRRVGNAAIEGATRALLSLTDRHRIEDLVTCAVHVELETDESFFDRFVDGCQFVPAPLPAHDPPRPAPPPDTLPVEAGGVPGAEKSPPPTYAFAPRALKKWSRDRLTLTEGADGSIAAVFRAAGSTCSNLGMPIATDYRVELRPGGAGGFTVAACTCAPASGDTGHGSTCLHLADPERHAAVLREMPPVLGQPLPGILAWDPPSNPAGCHCERSAREHKWKIVLQTLHYALLGPGAGSADADADAAAEVLGQLPVL